MYSKKKILYKHNIMNMTISIFLCLQLDVWKLDFSHSAVLHNAAQVSVHHERHF